LFLIRQYAVKYKILYPFQKISVIPLAVLFLSSLRYETSDRYSTNYTDLSSLETAHLGVQKPFTLRFESNNSGLPETVRKSIFNFVLKSRM